MCTVLQEIRYLAKLKSEHIVTYNHSWVEANLREKKKTKNKFTWDFDDYKDKDDSSNFEIEFFNSEEREHESKEISYSYSKTNKYCSEDSDDSEDKKIIIGKKEYRYL